MPYFFASISDEETDLIEKIVLIKLQAKIKYQEYLSSLGMLPHREDRWNEYNALLSRLRDTEQELDLIELFKEQCPYVVKVNNLQKTLINLFTETKHESESNARKFISDLLEIFRKNYAEVRKYWVTCNNLDFEDNINKLSNELFLLFKDYEQLSPINNSESVRKLVEYMEANLPDTLLEPQQITLKLPKQIIMPVQSSSSTLPLLSDNNQSLLNSSLPAAQALQMSASLPSLSQPTLLNTDTLTATAVALVWIYQNVKIVRFAADSVFSNLSKLGGSLFGKPKNKVEATHEQFEEEEYKMPVFHL